MTSASWWSGTKQTIGVCARPAHQERVRDRRGRDRGGRVAMAEDRSTLT